MDMSVAAVAHSMLLARAARDSLYSHKAWKDIKEK